MKEIDEEHDNEWSKHEIIGACGIVTVLFLILLVSTIGWMNETARLEQKYVCPCFRYYLNESTGYYEATRVISCQCMNVGIDEVRACSPISDTECRNVSNDKLVCDILIMENR